MIDKYFLSGLFFLCLAVLVVIRNYSSKRWINFFWFCDLAPFILAFAFFIRSDQLIKALISIGLLSQVISVFTLFAAIFLNVNLVGFGDILNYSRSYQAISFLLHLLSLNLAFFLVYDVQPKTISLVYSFIILLLLFFVTRILTKPRDNINYVYNSDFLGFSIPYYNLLAVFFFFIFVVLPTYALQYGVYLLFH